LQKSRHFYFVATTSFLLRVVSPEFWHFSFHLLALIEIMKQRAPLKITSRTSSITNSFVQAIIPTVELSPDEQREALAHLAMTPDDLHCAYCGAATTDWDHLRPLVKKKRPTGYISEIRNLVPSCGPCNQSKGAGDWRAWMTGKARGSPTTRNVASIQERMARLTQFEAWGNVHPIAFEGMISKAAWDAYWAQLDVVLDSMRLAQEKAATLREAIMRAIANQPAK
jgi:5-methylcytosine-specific restriction endonuclease McrA